jgi:hypothetical protein
MRCPNPLLIVITMFLPTALFIASADPAIAQSNLKNCPKSQSENRHNCFGTFRTNGSTYEGEFKNDTFDGQGTYTWPDGSKRVGEFSDAKLNGQVTVSYANGDVYSGTYVSDK